MGEQDPLAAAAGAFLDKLLPTLAENCPGPDDAPPLPLAGFVNWVPDDDRRIGRYKAVPRVFSVEQYAARMLGVLRAEGMTELAELESALASDPIIGPRLDQNVTSTGAGGQNWQPGSLVQMFVDRVLDEADGFDIPSGTREKLIAEWAEQLRRPVDRVVVIVALSEFRADDPPVDLASDLQIDLLRDDEISAALRMNAGRAGMALDERWVSPTFGIRSFYESRLYIGDIPPESSEEETALRTRAREPRIVCC
jgi:hypothetical protein